MNLLDLSKIFDTVDYNFLISKMVFYGVRKFQLNLLKTCLSERCWKWNGGYHIVLSWGLCCFFYMWMICWEIFQPGIGRSDRSVKFLGIHLNACINWKVHFQDIRITISRILTTLSLWPSMRTFTQRRLMELSSGRIVLSSN